MNRSGPGDLGRASALGAGGGTGEPGLVGACVIFALCFVVGAPGNALVVWTIWRRVRPRSHTVSLILHLAAADLLVVVTLPAWIYSLARRWVFGGAACKAAVYVIYVCMYASIFLITGMSVERFLAVRYPSASAAWRRKRTLGRILAAVWVSSCLFSVPVIFTQVLGGDAGEERCLYRVYGSDTQEAAILLLESLVGFLVPFCILVLCYGCLFGRMVRMNLRSKSKSTVVIASVVVLFALCWIPHHVGNLLSVVELALERGSRAKLSLHGFLEDMRLITSALVFVSSAVNPALYVLAARSFRSSLRDTGIHKLFRHLSSAAAAAEGSRDLSFVSKRPSSQTNTSQCCAESKAQLDLLVNICNGAGTDETV